MALVRVGDLNTAMYDASRYVRRIFNPTTRHAMRFEKMVRLGADTSGNHDARDEFAAWLDAGYRRKNPEPDKETQRGRWNHWMDRAQKTYLDLLRSRRATTSGVPMARIGSTGTAYLAERARPAKLNQFKKYLRGQGVPFVTDRGNILLAEEDVHRAPQAFALATALGYVAARSEFGGEDVIYFAPESEIPEGWEIERPKSAGLPVGFGPERWNRNRMTVVGGVRQMLATPNPERGGYNWLGPFSIGVNDLDTFEPSAAWCQRVRRKFSAYADGSHRGAYDAYLGLQNDGWAVENQPGWMMDTLPLGGS